MLSNGTTEFLFKITLASDEYSSNIVTFLSSDTYSKNLTYSEYCEKLGSK